MPTNRNISRDFSSGIGINNNTQQQRDLAQIGNPPILQRAVIVDIIFDPSTLTSEQMDWYEDHVINPELIEGMPTNTIIGRIITNSQDLGHVDLHVFYPLFPSHFQLPIKPGEQVLIMYEDYTGTGNSVGYWLTRPMMARQIEDPNYSHYDRIFDPFNHPRALPRDILTSLTASAPTFPNGANTQESYSLQRTSNNNPYDEIVANASASLVVTFEAVPRIKKRPGDLAMMGSNNTSIILGTDRTGPIVSVTGSNGKDILEQAGTIDIVAGLGSIRRLPLNESQDPSEDNHNPTSPRVIINTRQKEEIYKTPYKSQKEDNPKEGDPDFLRDLSRIYVSMKTKGDANFNIKLGGETGLLPNNENIFGQQIDDLPDDQQNGQSFIINKSEQIRLIATKKSEDNGPSENGELRFIKEGTIDDKDLGLFVMSKDGRILMIGKDVQIQTHEDGKILLKCKTAETGDSDPIVLYSKFKECIDDIYSKINDLKNSIADQIGNIGAQGITVPNAAGPFSPIPGLIGIKALTTAAQNTIKAVNVDFRNKIEPCRSKWVYVNKENQ